MRIAVLDTNNICVTLLETNGPWVFEKNEIDVSNEVENLIGRKYENNIWSTETFFEYGEAPSIEEQILAETQYQTAILEVNNLGGNV